ncbi:MAG TPA: ModE family transcriptional regulator [Thiomicrospira sp.]|jgi:molybdate transport system regulatory protein|nr:ModE family transcriptional regulator [Thiomicrospira sp.]
MSEKLNKLPGEAYTKTIHARFWLTGNDNYIGIGRITLLENIEKLGSMNAAAKEMKMSYKKAWKLVDEMNRTYDVPLVIKVQGGKAGGGTQLTDNGRAVIKKFRSLEVKLSAFLKKEAKDLGL